MPKRKIILIVISIIVIFIIGIIVFCFVLKSKMEKSSQVLPKEKTAQEILNSLTAPPGEKTEVSQKTLKSLSAPKGKNATTVAEDILNSLTAPQ